MQVACLIVPVVAACAHPGGRDQHGGHKDSATGTYHFHEGPLAGRTFASKELALMELRSLDNDTLATFPTAPTCEQKLDALIRVLVRRGLLDEAELALELVGTLDDSDAGGAPAGSFQVGWWNIRDFSDSSRDDEEVGFIANAITGIEVLAIGELSDRDVMPRLAAALGPTWDWAATAEKVGRTPHTAEYYGFVWDSRVVSMRGGVRVDADPGDAFDREPAFATFETTNGAFDFTMICVHVTWSGGTAARKAEIRALDDVWQRVQAATPNDKDLILVGDFNRNVGDDSFDDLLGLAGVVRANPDSAATKISSESSYDQIFVSQLETVEWQHDFAIVAFDEMLFDNDDKAANRACSDHRPVYISLVPGASDDP